MSSPETAASAAAVPGDGVVAEANVDLSGNLSSVDGVVFRAVMSSFATGVCIVTTTDDDGGARGLTCSAICSVSAEPPLLLCGVDSRSGTLSAIESRSRFVVNMLTRDAQEISQVFASRAPDKFEGVNYVGGEATGMPVLTNVVAHAECALVRTMQAGDHTLVLGRVVGGEAHAHGAPLTYWRGSYTQLFR